MKQLNRNLKVIKRILNERLRSKRGESIMEALVSLLILGILMTTIVSIIRFSMVVTGDSVRRATIAQTEINRLMFDIYDIDPDINPGGNEAQGALTFSNSELGVETMHDVVFYTNEGIIAFRPDSDGR